MVCLALEDAFADFINELIVFKSPAGYGKERGRRLRDETFQDYGGTEMFYEVDDEVDIFVWSKEMEIRGIGEIFISHARTFY